MRVQIYSGSMRLVAKSGVGQAMLHQKKMLDCVGIEATDSWDNQAPIHLNTVFPDAVLTALAAKIRGRKVIYYGHSTEEDFKGSFIGSNLLAPLFKRWITFCYGLGDAVITPTEYSRRLLIGYGIKKPVYSLTNGIDTSFFAPSEEAGRRFRSRYGLSDRDKVVISVGHFIQRKGLPEFVELARKMPEVRFFWFGETPLSMVPETIREAIRSAPVNLTFAGFVSQGELRDAYCGADLFAFLSQEETEGIVVLEALACGVPVLVRDIPVYSGWLRDGEQVYMADDQDGFYRRTADILSGKLPPLTEAALRTAESRSMAATGRKLCGIYHQLGIDEEVGQTVGAGSSPERKSCCLL